MKSEDKSFTFRLPSTLFNDAAAIAAKEDLSLAQLIRRVLREFVDASAAASASVEKEGK